MLLNLIKQFSSSQDLRNFKKQTISVQRRIFLKYQFIQKYTENCVDLKTSLFELA